MIRFLIIAIILSGMSIKETKQIATHIGSNISRINIANDELMEVVGDESRYRIYWTTDYRNIFIEPLTREGENITLSLVMVSGKVYDLVLTVEDMHSRTITIGDA